MKHSPIIEVNELLKIYNNANVLIFDVTNSKNALFNYEKEHIEGAYFVDLNTHLATIQADVAQGGRHPLPKIEWFAKTLSDLGISKENHIIVYDDNNGSNAAARFWWMLKSVGHSKVQVLNGGLKQAKLLNFPLSSKKELPTPLTEHYQIDQWLLPITEIEEVERVSQDPNYIIIDVRDNDRFNGINEPIDLIAGHIPGAINIPFTTNLDQNGLFLNPATLNKKYKAIFGDIKSNNIIVHCGSGVTACHTLLALSYADIDLPKLYVGSWSEWSRNNKQIA